MAFCIVRLLFLILIPVWMMYNSMNTYAQPNPVYMHLTPLPDKEGFAGMFAGVSNGSLVCMGGANFPDKRPWEGGKKKWYDDIYVLESSKWRRLKKKLLSPVAYGVSVTYNDIIILIGGNDQHAYSNKVIGYALTGSDIEMTSYPSLPVPLANMAGALVGHLIIICGGNNSSQGKGINECYGLDLEDPDKGWFEFPPLPGPGRVLPISGVHEGKFYLFSGETTSMSAGNEQYREILQDAYRLAPIKINGLWTGSWQKLAHMPMGMAAGGNMLPLIDNKFFFWGGVDAVTALQKDPVTATGIPRDMFFYHCDADTWEYLGKNDDVVSRVTLPVVYWNHKWIYVNGEIRAGTRTNTLVGLSFN
jgi:N-acetylneuraminate epimerase